MTPDAFAPRQTGLRHIAAQNEDRPNVADGEQRHGGEQEGGKQPDDDALGDAGRVDAEVRGDLEVARDQEGEGALDERTEEDADQSAEQTERQRLQ